MASRGSRFIVPATALSAIALIAVWFPFSTLFGQSAQLDSVSQQISQIQHESHVLSLQQKALSTKRAETLLAREEYQLVKPGQRLIQILNDNVGASLATGDPGNEPLIAPANATGLLPEGTGAPVSTKGHPSGFWSRVARTLEFWR